MPLQPKHLLSFITARRPAIRVALLAVITPLLLAPAIWQVAARHAPGPIQPGGLAIVSAANFGNAIAPDSIAAAFGTGLVNQTAAAAPGQPLPTQLGGVSVLVEESPGVGYLARLFFISPGQINLLIPSEISAGRKTVKVIKNSGGSTSAVASGEMDVKEVAPAIFTANQTGSGPAAALFLRVLAGGVQRFEPAFEPVPGQPGAFRAKVIPFEDQAVYLILFTTGLRRATLDVLRVVIGDEELTPEYVGPAPGFSGVEQINLLLPRSLKNQGAMAISIKTQSTLPPSLPVGFAAEQSDGITADTGITVQCLFFSPSTIQAAAELRIDVSRCNPAFTNPMSAYQVVFQADPGPPAVMAAESIDEVNKLVFVRVPFGAATGQIKLRTPNGVFESSQQLQITSSISGDFFDDIGGLDYVPVTVANPSGPNQPGETNSNGLFFIPNINVLRDGVIDYEFGGGHPNLLPAPAAPERHGGPVRCRRSSAGNGRDNQSSCDAGPSDKKPFDIQPAAFGDSSRLAAGAPEQNPTVTQQDVTLTLPKGVIATDSKGNSVKQLGLAVFPDWQAPARMPSRQYSTHIASLTPFDLSFNRGGQFSFPNTDKLPPGEQALLFFSPSPAEALERIGLATVSQDGMRIVTAEDAIRRTGFYFVSCSDGWRTGTVFGYVADPNGRPVSRALVSTRGRAVFTDINGGFVLAGVPVISRCAQGLPVTQTTIEISYMFPDPNQPKGSAPGSVLRARRTDVYVTADAETQVNPPIVLQPSLDKRQPVLIIPPVLTIVQGLDKLDAEFAALDPDSAQPLKLPTASSPSIPRNTINVERVSTSTYILRLSELNKLPLGGYPITLMVEGNGFKVSQTIALHIVSADPSQIIAPPIARTTPENTTVTIPFILPGLPGVNAVFRVVAQPAHGTADASSNSVRYTPARDFSGLDRFTYQACVGGVWSNNCSGGRVSNVAVVYVSVIPAIKPTMLELPGSAAQGQPTALPRHSAPFSPTNGNAYASSGERK